MNRYMDAPEVQALCEALLLLETKEEIADFLTDIMTVSEVRAVSQRLQVAKHLYNTEDTYETISHKYGVSAVTISRVKNSLLYGTGGYETLLKRLNEKEAE